MNELQSILDTYDAQRNSGARLMLATVVKVRGSTYRRPGARMLMSESGTTVGSISGGCLEADVFEKAKKSVLSGEPQMVVYDMVAEDDVWGLNQGCNGVITLLIEPVERERSATFEFVRTCFQQRRRGAMASVFRVDGEFKARIGTRLMMFDNGSISEDVRNPVLSAALAEDCRNALRTAHSAVKEYRFLEGVVEAFVEVIQPPVHVVVFGAGTDAIPVARLAKELGWRVTIVDHKPALATRERFPTADALVLARPEEIADKLSFTSDSVVMIMTHNFSHDFQLLRALLPVRPTYLGLLGPKKRTELLLQKIRESGLTPSSDQLERLHNPAGIDIGAESPEQIALSILAEIQAVLTNRGGGFLRDTPGPIHAPQL